MIDKIADQLTTLQTLLDEIGQVAVAVSGGVDSLTLATVAQQQLGARTAMYHAVSPAVPMQATERVQRLATQQHWRLQILDTGEFQRQDYINNPVNRCFYCKTSLYGTIRPHTAAQIVSGTNTDDLGEYRPGLQAADDHAVRHPFVEAGIDKATVRIIARHYELGDVAELPAAPCLSSRIETGISIQPDMLALVHAVEQFVAARLQPRTVRCRVREEGVVIELDDTSLKTLTPLRIKTLSRVIASMFSEGGFVYSVRFAAYRSGSAFLHTPV